MKTILYASLSFFLVLTTTRTAQAQAGTIAPNAVTIPMDQRGTLSEFVDGVAIIRRGDAVGLINHRGEMVVPYNQYKSILPLTDGYSYVQNETYKYGVVDGTGKQVVPCEYNEPKSMTGIGPYLGAGYIYLCTKHDSPGEIRDLRTGKIAPAPSKKQILFALGDGMAPLDYPHYPARQTGIGLVPARERVDKYQQRTVPIGFVDFSGNWVIAPKFLRVHPFSDDLAAAMIVDEFGEGKWGFIDRTGAWVISPRFTNEPGDFHHGRARVRPRDEVLDQFIDRKGEVVVKLGSDPASNGYANGVLVAVVENGQTYSLIDSTGSARPFPNEGAVDGRTFQFDVSQDSDRPEGFVVSRLKNGLADLNGVLIIPPMFDSNFRFDTVSGLALASFTSSDGKRIEGYIDRTGRFALIKGAESKW